MKKTVLSLCAAALFSGMLFADTVTLYNDPTTGQIFSEAGEGRVKIGEFVDAKTAHKSVPVYAHTSKLKFSGLTYIGFTHTDFEDGETSTGGDYKEDISRFEIRRAYLQLKAYLMEDPKSYYRITLDVHQDTKADNGGTDGDMLLRVKYAYIYLNDILPHTGVEFGIAHRPWHDYEEHTAWYYRDISKVLVEQGNGAHLSNSADFGLNFKTKTTYFDSELGIYNGEGYHSTQIKEGLSFEWRATAHILGVRGKDKQTKKSYWDVSFFGQYNKKHKDNGNGGFDDLVFGGLHTVYNRPDFLAAAQYVRSLDTADESGRVSKQAGSGYSVNGEYRFGTEYQYRILARYDSWTPEKQNGADEKEQRTYIAGFAWQQNHNLQWVVNVDVTDNEEGSEREKYNGSSLMLTAQIEF